MKSGYVLPVIAVLMVLTACSFHSRPPEIPRPTSDVRLETLKKGLNLTDEQLRAITPIVLQEFADTEKVISAQKKGDRKAMNESLLQIEDIEWQTYKRLSEHLTKEQMDLYNQVLKEESERLKEQNSPHDGGRGPQGGSRPGR